MADCGQAPCRDFVDDVATRLEGMFSKQHEQGIQNIKEILTLHHNQIQAQVNEMKITAKTHEDEVFGRLRKVENKQVQMEATAITEEKVKEIVSGNDGVKWATGQKGWMKAVWTAVSIAAIYACVDLIVSIKTTQQVQQTTKITGK